MWDQRLTLGAVHPGVLARIGDHVIMPDDPHGKPSSGPGNAFDMDADQFRKSGHQLVDQIADFLGGIRNVRASHDLTPEDARALKQMGIARVYTPKDFKITEIMGDVTKLVEKAWLVKG